MQTPDDVCTVRCTDVGCWVFTTAEKQKQSLVSASDSSELGRLSAIEKVNRFILEVAKVLPCQSRLSMFLRVSGKSPQLPFSRFCLCLYRFFQDNIYRHRLIQHTIATLEVISLNLNRMQVRVKPFSSALS